MDEVKMTDQNDLWINCDTFANAIKKSSEVCWVPPSPDCRGFALESWWKMHSAPLICTPRRNSFLRPWKYFANANNLNRAVCTDRSRIIMAFRLPQKGVLLDMRTVCLSPVYTMLSNRFDNRLNVCIHDTTGCQSGCQTGLTTGCIVYRNIQPVVKPVWQPVWQPAVSCIQPVVKPVVQ